MCCRISSIVVVLIALIGAGIPLIGGCAAGVDLDALQKFQAAQQAFDQAESPEQFRKVAAMYQEILDRGTVSGAVLDNQGNAWMRAGCPGRAVAAYRQAQRYRPNDPYLRANLRNALAADDTAARRKPVIEYLLFWQDWLSYPAKFHLVGVAAGVAFVLGVLALLIRRRLFRRLAVAAVAVTSLLIFSAGYDWYRFDHIIHGVITQDEVIARKGNATSYKPAFTEPIGEGTEFRVLSGRGDWLLIRLAGGQEGWIERDAAVVY